MLKLNDINAPHGANREKKQTRYYICFAIAIASAMGIAFAGNLFTLFLFYEILTISTYPLVTHKGNEEARNGGRVYLLILLGTSMLLLLPAIFILEMALARLWMRFGVMPDALLGHSLGENTAACLAGASSPQLLATPLLHCAASRGRSSRRRRATARSNASCRSAT